MATVPTEREPKNAAKISDKMCKTFGQNREWGDV